MGNPIAPQRADSDSLDVVYTLVDPAAGIRYRNEWVIHHTVYSAQYNDKDLSLDYYVQIS